MALEIVTKTAEIQAWTANVKTLHEASCAAFPWSTIQAQLDLIDTESAALESSALSILNDDFGSMTDSSKHYGMLCGVESVLGDSNMSNIFSSKWSIFDKIASGNFLDSNIVLLSDTNGLSCSELSLYLDSVLANLGSNDTYLNYVISYLASLDLLNSEIMGIIGGLGSILGCSDSMYSSLQNSSSWIDEINSDLSQSLASVEVGKAAGGTPGDIYNKSLEDVTEKMNWTSQIENLKEDFFALDLEYPT